MELNLPLIKDCIVFIIIIITLLIIFHSLK